MSSSEGTLIARFDLDKIPFLYKWKELVYSKGIKIRERLQDLILQDLKNMEEEDGFDKLKANSQ